MNLGDLLKVIPFNEKLVITYYKNGEIKDLLTNPVEVENNYIFLNDLNVKSLYKCKSDNLIHILLLPCSC